MTTWRIKEISELTQTSIRMLRHYDKIGLLTPSYREPNGYRCYTEMDLAKLQQIIALRYFGFSLSKIKEILQKHHNIYAHLQAQQHIVNKQKEHWQQVGLVLEDILNRLSPSMPPDWSDLITLIGRYNMTETLREKLRKGWAGKVLTADQFEEYLLIYEQFPDEFAMRDRIIEQINQQAVGEPESAEGERIVCFLHEFAKKMKQFFTKQIKLNASILENIRSGKLTQLEITPEGAHWLGRATIAYWLKRWDGLYDDIVNNMKFSPESESGKQVATTWRNLLDDFFSVGSRDFLTGIILWQETARQHHEIKELKSIPSPQEMLKQCHIKLLFNAEASAWISKALEVHH